MSFEYPYIHLYKFLLIRKKKPWKLESFAVVHCIKGVIICGLFVSNCFQLQLAFKSPLTWSSKFVLQKKVHWDGGKCHLRWKKAKPNRLLIVIQSIFILLVPLPSIKDICVPSSIVARDTGITIRRCLGVLKKMGKLHRHLLKFDLNYIWYLSYYPWRRLV